MREFDLLVVGTGPAGSTIATRLAKKGTRVAIAENREPGGTCALRGCNPKKVLVEAAAAAQRARDAGSAVGEFAAALDWPRLMRFKATFVDPVTPGTVEKFDKAGIALLRGGASFVSGDEVEVGGERVKARRVVLATGARPADLHFEGSDLVATSDQFLELDELPARILFVGGGFISMEFAHVAVRAGADVTVVQRGDRLLKPFDPELVAKLTEHTRKLGVNVRTGCEVERIARSDGHLEVRFSKGPPQEFDLVVHGAGRVPNLDGLALEKADVAWDEQGVQVDEFLQSTTNPSVLAVGDCAASGAPRLTPVANAHSHAVVQNLPADEPSHRPDIEGVASVAFTIPPIARAGLSVAGAEEQGLSFEVLEHDMSEWSSVRKVGASVAGCRILAHKGTKKVLGAHLLGPRADETINLFTLALRAGMTTKDLKAAPLAFPTFAHDVREMV